MWYSVLKKFDSCHGVDKFLPDVGFWNVFSGYSQFKVDIDANRETAYVYNSSGSLGLAAQRHKLPIARYKDHILYLLEKHQVKFLPVASDPS